MTGTTPVPNTIFDCWLKELQGSELKVLLIIIRQTLGWQDDSSPTNRKQLDWLSTSQLMNKTGCSRRAISSALETLTTKSIINVLDSTGNVLRSAQERKGEQKLFFSLARSPTATFMGINCGLPDIKKSTSANNTHDLSKNIKSLAQKMRITK